MSDGSTDSEISLERVLALLGRWRHLPAYQLERRADVLFAMFLPKVLGEQFKIDVNPLLIPEFPIKNEGDNQSKKVDFFAVQESESPRQAFLIELKTDMASWREEQDEYLRDAVRGGLQKLVLDTIAICRATDERTRRKYVHLLYLLSCLNLIKYEDALFRQRRDYLKALDKIQSQVKCRRDWPSLEVVYVQPRLPSNIIDFCRFAEIIKEDGTDVSTRFACYLKEWTDHKAGDRDPKDWSRS